MSSLPLLSIAQSFSKELAAASQGDSTSLPFIRHTMASSIPTTSSVTALVVGGTNWSIANISTDYTLANKKNGVRDTFDTSGEFLSFIESVVPTDASFLALNFAYPLNPINREGMLDGTLVSGSKEDKFTGLIGAPIGKIIEKHLMSTRGQKIHVSAANDTICLLLSGLTQFSWDTLAAAIVGTGLNHALFLDQSTAINLESAEFNKFTQSEEGATICEESVAPDEGWYEKETAGAYLYKHFNLKAKKLNIDTHISDTQELDGLANDPEQPQAVQQLAQEVLTHSATLVGAQIAGILEFQKRDLIFTTQGSLFWKGYNYKTTVEGTIAELTKHKAKFISIENTDLLGAAKLII